MQICSSIASCAARHYSRHVGYMYLRCSVQKHQMCWPTPKSRSDQSSPSRGTMQVPPLLHESQLYIQAPYHANVQERSRLQGRTLQIHSSTNSLQIQSLHECKMSV